MHEIPELGEECSVKLVFNSLNYAFFILISHCISSLNRLWLVSL